MNLGGVVVVPKMFLEILKMWTKIMRPDAPSKHRSHSISGFPGLKKVFDRV